MTAAKLRADIPVLNARGRARTRFRHGKQGRAPGGVFVEHESDASPNHRWLIGCR